MIDNELFDAPSSEMAYEILEISEDQQVLLVGVQDSFGEYADLLIA